MGPDLEFSPLSPGPRAGARGCMGEQGRPVLGWWEEITLEPPGTCFFLTWLASLTLLYLPMGSQWLPELEAWHAVSPPFPGPGLIVI